MEKYKIWLLVIQLSIVFFAILVFAVPFEFKVKGYYTQESYQAEEEYVKLQEFKNSRLIYDNKTRLDCRQEKVDYTLRFTYEWQKDWSGLTTCYITNNENETINITYSFKHKPTVGPWQGDGSGPAIISPGETLILKKNYVNIAEENVANCDVDQVTFICPVIVQILDTYNVVDFVEYKNVTKLRNVTRYRDVYMSGETIQRATLFKHYILNRG